MPEHAPSVAVSSITTTFIIIAGVILLIPLQGFLSNPAIKTASNYLLPALFGGIFLNFVNDDCGEYIAKGKSLVLIIPTLLVFVVNAFYPLSGKEGFVVLACMFLNVLCAWVFYKTGIIKMTLKSDLKAKAEANKKAEEAEK